MDHKESSLLSGGAAFKVRARVYAICMRRRWRINPLDLARGINLICARTVRRVNTSSARRAAFILNASIFLRAPRWQDLASAPAQKASCAPAHTAAPPEYVFSVSPLERQRTRVRHRSPLSRVSLRRACDINLCACLWISPLHTQKMRRRWMEMTHAEWAACRWNCRFFVLQEMCFGLKFMKIYCFLSTPNWVF